MTHTSEKEIKWPEPNALKAGLYLVATPIGNLRDISLRALDVLASVDVIYCEDTRVSGKLLKAYSISKPLAVYNDHSDEKKRALILKAIEEGRAIALISDAGSPLISDPGYKLVRDCMAKNLMVTNIPGACAAISAMQISGLPSDQFCFLGFLPAKEKARRAALEQWKTVGATLVFYETGPRLLAALKDIRQSLGGRELSVVREITKMFEQVVFDHVDNLIAKYENDGAPKGEIVLVVEGAKDEVWTKEALEQELVEAMKSMKTKEAANYVSGKSGAPKKELYEIALELKSS
tara:strand:+ start:318 stop:1193 length:876 start_codon:yes stop_codon:yes gene_type:complete